MLNNDISNDVDENNIDLVEPNYDKIEYEITAHSDFVDTMHFEHVDNYEFDASLEINYEYQLHKGQEFSDKYTLIDNVTRYAMFVNQAYKSLNQTRKFGMRSVTNAIGFYEPM